MEKFWPYILPLPKKTAQQYRVLLSAFGSKLSLEILKRTSPERKVYQRDLIATLPYSNKTVIDYLNKLVSTGILESGMERIRVRNRTIWAKWYSPTPLGRWFALLLLPTDDFGLDESKRTLSEIFDIYLENVSELCLKLGLSPVVLASRVYQAYVTRVVEKERKVCRRSDVLVFGSAAVDYSIMVETIPDLDESIMVSEHLESPGGSGANVAAALSRLGVSTSFIGRVAPDIYGCLVVEALKREGVDLSDLKMCPDLRTLRTVIMTNGQGGKRIFSPIGESTAISIVSPNEVNWNRFDECKAVYIGEAYLEVAELVASYAKSRNKLVFYRLLAPYAYYGLQRIGKILKNVDLLLMNEKTYESLKKSSTELYLPKDLLQYGLKTVTVTVAEKGSKVFTAGETFEVPAVEIATVDTTGAGDAFVAALIKAILDRAQIKAAIRYATVAAALSTTKPTGMRSMPTKNEVDQLFKEQREG